MSESTRKKLTQQAMLNSEPRCVYCESTGPLTVEHMPPRSMFKASQRPKGMEFAACGMCNNGTRAADALAAMMARCGPDLAPWKAREFQRLADTVAQLAPAALEEISGGKMTPKLARYSDGIVRPTFDIDIVGTAVRTQMGAFATKLGMAAYRHHAGHALPLAGLVWTHWIYNVGMTPERLKAWTSIMPSGATLSQGKVEVSDQFYYRYNTDGATTVVLTAGFHTTIWMMAIASSHPATVDGLRQINSLHPSALAGPGGLIDILAGGGPRGKILEKSN